MSKHTPGPWRIGTPPPNGEQTVGTQQGLMVAVATTGAGMPTEANARLIAVVPELLEALKHAVEIAENKRPGTWDDLLPYRVLIAKAEGGNDE